MGILIDLRDKLVRKLASSFLLARLDGYKTDIARVVQAINMVIAALYLVVPIVDSYGGFSLSSPLDFLNAKWLIALQFLTHLGLEFGIQDGKAKANLAENA